MKRPFIPRNRKPDGIGTRYGRLVISECAPPYVQPSTGVRQRRWLVRCDCGAEKIVTQHGLRTGKTKSCGCLNEEMKRSRVDHGHACRSDNRKPTRTFNAWRTMLQRCTNPKAEQWKNYGARGITICDRWRQSFSNFLADLGEAPEGMTLERTNVNGNYEPSNCVWASPKEQARNTRRARKVTFQGREMPLKEACEITGAKYSTAYWRLKAGHSLEWVLTP